VNLRALASLLLVAGLAACESAPVRTVRDTVSGLFQANKGQAALNAGLKQYDDGEYAEAAKNLNASIQQGLADADRVKAHKHLAFIHCISGRTVACRDEFRRALAVDPAMELAPAEAGHPTWGPAFRSAKAGR
jgi:Tfp pilus assembly protein PilF